MSNRKKARKGRRRPRPTTPSVADSSPVFEGLADALLKGSADRAERVTAALAELSRLEQIARLSGREDDARALDDTATRLANAALPHL